MLCDPAVTHSDFFFLFRVPRHMTHSDPSSYGDLCPIAEVNFLCLSRGL